MTQRSRLFNRRGFAESVSMHQFRDCVAIYFAQHDGGGREPCGMETAYLTASMARKFAQALESFANEIESGTGDWKNRRIEP